MDQPQPGDIRVIASRHALLPGIGDGPGTDARGERYKKSKKTAAWNISPKEIQRNRRPIYWAAAEGKTARGRYAHRHQHTRGG